MLTIFYISHKIDVKLPNIVYPKGTRKRDHKINNRTFVFKVWYLKYIYILVYFKCNP